MQAAAVMEEQLAALGKLGGFIKDEHAYWSDVKESGPGTPLGNLNSFYADVQFEETLERISADWAAAKARCSEQARWLQACDKPKAGDQVKAADFLEIIRKVSLAATRVLARDRQGGPAGRRAARNLSGPWPAHSPFRLAVVDSARWAAVLTPGHGTLSLPACQ